MEPTADPGPHDEAPFHLTLFASILLRRPFDALADDDATIVRWAASEAGRWCADGRAAGLGEDVLAYRFVYRSLRAQAEHAAPIELAERGPRWEKVLRAACMLRHRQRAVLALYYCGALSPKDAGVVVRASETQARAVIESAVAGVAKLLGEPADVRRSLRMAAARLRAQRETVVEHDDAPLPRIPRPHHRPVMDLWIERPTADGMWPVPLEAPVVTPAVAQTRGSPVRALLADIVPATTPEQLVVVPPPPSPVIIPPRPRPNHRALFAAVAALLVLAVLTPGFAGDQSRPDTPTIQAVDSFSEPVVVRTVARAPRVMDATLMRVRFGDSLWLIALEHLGDGERWRLIWLRNRGRVMPDGERFTRPDLIHPGWTLLVPRERGRA